MMAKMTPPKFPVAPTMPERIPANALANHLGKKEREMDGL
jgi:hypothetical protein